jgi:phage shock protein C
MNTTSRALRRSQTDRVFLGICGGMGEFLGISPWWFRLFFLIAALPGGVPGLSLYLLLWLMIPAA